MGRLITPVEGGFRGGQICLAWLAEAWPDPYPSLVVPKTEFSSKKGEMLKTAYQSNLRLQGKLVFQGRTGVYTEAKLYFPILFPDEVAARS
jgi:hypothetical protein